MVLSLLQWCWIQVISATYLPIKASRGVKPSTTFLGVKFNSKILLSISLSVRVAIPRQLSMKRPSLQFILFCSFYQSVYRLFFLLSAFADLILKCPACGMSDIFWSCCIKNSYLLYMLFPSCSFRDSEAAELIPAESDISSACIRTVLFFRVKPREGRGNSLGKLPCRKTGQRYSTCSCVLCWVPSLLLSQSSLQAPSLPPLLPPLLYLHRLRVLCSLSWIQSWSDHRFQGLDHLYRLFKHLVPDSHLFHYQNLSFYR